MPIIDGSKMHTTSVMIPEIWIKKLKQCDLSISEQVRMVFKLILESRFPGETFEIPMKESARYHKYLAMEKKRRK